MKVKGNFKGDHTGRLELLIEVFDEFKKGIPSHLWVGNFSFKAYDVRKDPATGELKGKMFVQFPDMEYRDFEKIIQDFFRNIPGVFNLEFN